MESPLTPLTPVAENGEQKVVDHGPAPADDKIKKPQLHGSKKDSGSMLSQAYLTEKFKEQIAAFDRSIANFIKVGSRTCSVCKQMGIKKIGKCLNKVEELKTVCKINNSIVQRLIQYYSPDSDEALTEDQLAHDEVIEVDEYTAEDELAEVVSEDVDSEEDVGDCFVICDRCFSAIKHDEMPLFAELNGFTFEKLPEVLADLNFYERLLIQRARSFQTIIQLKPYRMVNSSGYFVKALKGLVVHLPLNTACTVNYTFKTLPSSDMLNVLVYSLPNSKKQLWKNLVDLNKVTEALNYLKSFNKEYSDIEIVDWKEKEMADESIMFVSKEQLDNCDMVKSTLSQNHSEADKLIDPVILKKSVDPVVPKKLEDLVVPSQCSGCCVNVPSKNLLPTGGSVDEEAQLEAESNLQHVVCSSEIEGQYTVMSVQTPTSDQTDTALYQQKRIDGVIVPIGDSTVELRSFPQLYPDGKNHSAEVREKTVRLNMFTKAILNHEERRFAKDFAYIFFLYHKAEQKALDQGIFACLHSKSQRYTAQQFRQMASEELNKELEANLSMVFAARRGSSDYWSKINGDLRAVDEECGPATWFVTLSSAEYKWSDLWEYLAMMNKDIPGVERMQQAKLCTEDPVSFAKFFYHRFKVFFTEVICHPKGPLGCIIVFFWRLEYQARGAPHIHMKLWCKDAPMLGKDDPSVIQKFLADKITCHIPSVKDGLELHDLVTKLQVHKCTASCIRFRKCGNGQTVSYCRYGYPRKECEEFKLNTAADTVKSRQSSRRMKRLYDLPRTYAERNVNDYNPLLLLLWKANIDVQYIGEYSFILNKYVTSYVTKGERSATAELWECLQQMSSERSHASRLKSLGLFKLKDREAGVYEVAHANLGLPFYGFSDHVRYLNVGYKKERRRKLKKKAEIAQLEDDSTELFCSNVSDDYYPARPEALENCSLHDFAAAYAYSKVKPKGKTRTTVLPLANNLGFVRQRCKAQIIKINHISTKTAEGLEKYFRGLLMLYKPWRDECNLMEGYQTYQEAFVAAKGSFPKMESRFESRKRLEDAEVLIERLKAEADKEQAVNKEVASENKQVQEFTSVAENALELKGSIVQQSEDQLVPIPTIEAETVSNMDESVNSTGVMLKCSAVELENSIAGLNIDQRKVFDEVVGHVTHQELHRKGKCSCVDKPGSFTGLVSGVGGCGKSFLIDVIAQQLRFSYSEVWNGGKTEIEDPVHITAPTGLAAFNVRGMTIHKKLKLPVQHGDEHTFMHLYRDEEKLLQASLKNIHLLIVDEFSMVSNVTLLCIHLRLQQVFKSEADFGGVNLLLFGDLLQLKPVRGSFCFETIKKQEMRKHFAGAVGLAPALLKNAHYFELQQNMRQKGDLSFAEMLSRIRLGSPTSEDISLLKTRIVKGTELVKLPTETDGISEMNSSVGISNEGHSGMKQQSGDLRHTRVLKDQLVPLEDHPAVSSRRDMSAVFGDINPYLFNGTQLFSEILKKDQRAVCLLPKNDMVDAFNEAMIKEAHIETVTILAVDYDSGLNKKVNKKRGVTKRKTKSKKLKASDTAGLQEQLILGVGARVMLRRNICLEEGLVNGAIGYITSITEPVSTPPSIFVHFEDHSSPTKITPVSADFEVSKGIVISRRQFPLCLGYALTIHKVITL